MGQMAGAGTDTLSFSKALYLPLSGSQEVMGVLRVLPADNDLFISIDKMHLLEACVNQIALALEVDRLNERSQVGDLHPEVDRVRGALMQSVSHDLRKPLVAIIGAASTQMELAKTMDAHAIEKNGRDIYDEAEQLSRLINNLLQITYFEANQVKLQKNLAPIEDVINLVIHTAGKKLAGRKVTVHVSDQPPPVPYDQTLIQEVLFNLIDNAVKFTVAGTDIDIYVNVNKDNLQVCVDDCGPGIVADEVNMLFEKYYRGRMLTTERGLGLGLAICRMVIEAHGGRMWVENKVRGGSSFCFTLPLH
jgi:two-component system sensor histidine kinase KdpD